LATLDILTLPEAFGATGVARLVDAQRLAEDGANQRNARRTL
jgi:hypothetical protein